MYLMEDNERRENMPEILFFSAADNTNLAHIVMVKRGCFEILLSEHSLHALHLVAC